MLVALRVSVTKLLAVTSLDDNVLCSDMFDRAIQGCCNLPCSAGRPGDMVESRPHQRCCMKAADVLETDINPSALLDSKPHSDD